MKKEYNFGAMNPRPNPYAKRLKKQVTIRLGTDVIDYFKKLSIENGVPYQSLINSYLSDCAAKKRKMTTSWAS